MFHFEGMPWCKSAFFSLLCPQGSSQLISPLWFYVDVIRNPTQVFPFRFPTLFLVPTIPCTRPHHQRPAASSKQLPWPLVLYYALTSTHCLPIPCIQQPNIQWYKILCSIRLEPILSLLSTILSPPFVLASSWLTMSSFRVSFGSTRDDIRLLFLGRIGFAAPLSSRLWFS